MGPIKPSVYSALLGTGVVALVLGACSQAPQPAAPASEPAIAAVAAPLVAPAAEAAPVVQSAPAPADEPKPVVHKRIAPRPVHHAAAPVKAVTAPEPTAAPAREPMTVCTNCGVITAITPVKNEGKGTAVGVVAGGLAGLVLGNQIGGGNGKTIAKVAGAAGGALLGNKIEKKIRAQTSYEIRVRLDDGTETTVSQETEPKLAVGAAVKIVDGSVVGK
jgi:outer membrane lipoprotein SlyB